MAKSSIEAKLIATFLLIMTIVLAANGDRPDCPPCCNWEKCCKFTTCTSCNLNCDLICPPCPNTTRIPEPNSRNRADEDSNSLLVGKLITQGSVRSEVLEEGTRSQEVKPDQIEEVIGKEIAESARQHVQPEDELQVGSLIEEYEKHPSDREIHIRTHGRWRDVKRVSGKVLDDNVQTGRYVADPVKVLAELKAQGEIVETVKAEIVAGDAANLNVVDMKETTVVKDGPSIIEQPAVEIGTGPMLEGPRQDKSLKCHVNEKGAEPKEETCPPGTKYCNYIDRNGVVTRNCSSGLGVWPRVRCTRASWFTSCLCEGDNCNADCKWSNCTKIAISRSIDSVPDKTMLNCNANCKAGDGKLPSIVEAAQSIPYLSTLVTAVTAAGLVDTLNGKGPFTVFAPNNYAFDDTLVDLLEPENVVLLKETLLRHVVSGSYKAADIPKGNTSLTTAGGDSIMVTNADKVTIKSAVGGATVRETDIMASNGVIHVVDTVF